MFWIKCIDWMYLINGLEFVDMDFNYMYEFILSNIRIDMQYVIY